MKSLLLILNLLLIFTFELFPQEFSWEKLDQPDSSIFKCLKEDPNGVLFSFNVTKRKIVKSIDHGLTWQICSPDTNWSFETFNVDKNGTLYLSGRTLVDRYIPPKYALRPLTVTSGDSGKSWKYIDMMASVAGRFFFDNTGHVWATNVVLNPAEQVLTASVWKLSDDRSKWTVIKSFGYGSYAPCIFFDNKNNILLSAYENPTSTSYDNMYNLYRSSDNGLTWTNSRLSDRYLLASDIKQSSNGYIFLVNRSPEAGKLLFRSTDGGNSWENISLAPNIPPDILFIEIDKNDNIIVGTSNKGILYSNDYGNSWDAINTGLETGQITTLLIAKDGYIYAGVNNKGLFRTVQTSNYLADSVQKANKIKSFELKQNYPNPFNPSTKISYSIPEGRNVRLTIYDMLGKEITTLVNEYKSAGSYTIQFNGSSLPSGIYIYTLQAGEFSDSKKLLLLR